MKIGLVDVDSHNFPNLPLMKLSAFWKRHDAEVEFIKPFQHYDKVYMSKVFTFSPDYIYAIDADEIIKGGSGYFITLENGKEKFDSENHFELPDEIEHIYPDYSLYNIQDHAYGFLTRGCPRGCHFCIVGKKEGLCSRKVADLSEFWNGQREITLLDPNILACQERTELLRQLIDSKAKVEFNQGLDARLLTVEIIEMLNEFKSIKCNFAWDNYKDLDLVLPKLALFSKHTRYNCREINVYCLVNFDSTLEQDLARIYKIRDLGFHPFVMVYNKKSARKEIRQLQRWANNRFLFWTIKSFDDYKKQNLASDPNVCFDFSLD